MLKTGKTRSKPMGKSKFTHTKIEPKSESLNCKLHNPLHFDKSLIQTKQTCKERKRNYLSLLIHLHPQRRSRTLDRLRQVYNPIRFRPHSHIPQFVRLQYPSVWVIRLR
ncbi:hypothetical protein ACB092_11G033700 [Castanea dentata]